jgi:hypothetical protein
LVKWFAWVNSDVFLDPTEPTFEIINPALTVRVVFALSLKMMPVIKVGA